MSPEQRRNLETPGAVPAFDAGLPATPGPATADLFAAAVRAHQAGVLGEAERQYRSILALDPGHANSLHNLCLLYTSRCV